MENEEKRTNKRSLGLVITAVVVILLILIVVIAVIPSLKVSMTPQADEPKEGYHTLILEEGSIQIEDIPGLTYADSQYMISASNSDYYVTYGDSYVTVGKDEEVDGWVSKNIAVNPEYTQKGDYVTINDRKCYVITNEKKDSNDVSVYILQDIGIGRYIEIRITCSDGTKPQELIEKFALSN